MSNGRSRLSLFGSWLLLAGLIGCGGASEEERATSTAAPRAVTQASSLEAGTLQDVSRRKVQSSGAVTPALGADDLFDWAEYAYPDLFPAGPLSGAISHLGVDYTVRSYRTGNHLGLTPAGEVFGLGPFTGSALLRLGTLGDFAGRVQADRCKVHPNRCTESPPSQCPAGTRTMAQVSVGYNVNTLFWEGLYGDPQMQAAVKALGKPTLRWPGGTEADYFDWSAGRPVEGCRYAGCRSWDTLTLARPPLFQRFGDHTQGTPANWSRLNKAVEGRSILVANMVTASPAEMTHWLRQASDAGLDVERIELGNEPYFAQVEGTDNNRRAFPSARDHVAAARELATRIRREFPAALLAQPAFVPRVNIATGAVSDGHDERMLSWNDEILSAGASDYADAFALHFYPQLPARGSDGDAAYLGRLAEFATAYWRLTLQTPQWKALPANKPLWITEFNVSFAAAPELQGTWTHALYMAQFALLALSDPRVDHMIVHMLTGNPQWQSVVHPGRVPDIPAPSPGDAYAATPAGAAMAALASGLDGAHCGQPVDPTEFRGMSAAGSAVGWRSTVAGRSTVVVVNMASSAIDFDITRGGWSSASGVSYSASPLVRMTAARGVTRTPVVAVGGVLRVPAHAVVVVSP